MKRKSLILIVILYIMVFAFNTVIFAMTADEFITGKEPIAPNDGVQISTVVPKIWSSVKLILQVLALTAFLFTGIKYMLSSADQKADIKKSLIATVIGVAIVYGTTIVIDFVTGVAKQVMG